MTSWRARSAADDSRSEDVLQHFRTTRSVPQTEGGRVRRGHDRGMDQTAPGPDGSLRPIEAKGPSRRPRPRFVEFAVALVGGVLLGVMDLVAQRSLPYPWANLANSGAVWAVGAFAIGMWVGPWASRAAVAGALLLVAAVESYYLSAVVVRLDDVSTLWTARSLMWLVLGVLVGALFGVAGAATRRPQRWAQMAGAGLVALVFLLEAVHILNRPAGTRTHSDLQTAVIEFGLAIMLPMIVLLAAPHHNTSTRRPT